MGIGKTLLKLARRALEAALGKITQNINIIDGIAQMVVGAYVASIDSTWEGDDKVAFINEVNSRLKPEFEALIGGLNLIPNNINRAMQIIEDADQQARGIVGEVVDLFNAIF